MFRSILLGTKHLSPNNRKLVQKQLANFLNWRTGKGKFKYIRNQALKEWRNISGRKAAKDKKYPLFADYPHHGVEYVWMHLAVDVAKERGLVKPDERWHTCIFCGVWHSACGITDMLTDTRYDKLPFKPYDHFSRSYLFRFHTRLYLEIYNLLVDMEVIYKKLTGKSDGRKQLSKAIGNDKSTLEMNTFLGFTNKIFKHRIGTSNTDYSPLHQQSHHARYLFERIDDVSKFDKVLSTNTYNTLTEYQAIDFVVVPNVFEVLDLVKRAYTNLTDVMEIQEERLFELTKKHGTKDVKDPYDDFEL